ncbi:hypothetical protein ZIOFF_018228 [Zingiber officinale]|uniref:Uncharacterized protein n=1 Tax=Zingiber officinale TaxID=94328 RepID=A0A8J5HQ38_ZINOF|nr:hypothetical protein ZIOFF_018228 [Zingiber officinale]
MTRGLLVSGIVDSALIRHCGRKVSFHGRSTHLYWLGLDGLITVKVTARDNYDVYSSLDQADSYSSQTLDDNIPIRDEDNAWVREDLVVDGAIDLGQDEEVAENDETY